MRRLLLGLGLLFVHSAQSAETLFQNRFFTLSQSNQLLCTTSQEGFLPTGNLDTILFFYEKDHPTLRDEAVAVLTDHQHPDHLEDLDDFNKACSNSHSKALCKLEAYWDDDRETAKRVLALFYDTKTVIKHSDNPEVPHFKPDHVRIFEKSLRKIPAALRQRISKAKPNDNLEEEIASQPTAIQTLILNAFPKDYRTSIWEDHTHPLTFVPGHGFRSKTVGQVFSGQNLIVFTPKAFDKAKEGKVYRDIGVAYLVDFRLPIVVHEIAHTIDNFHFWNGQDDLYFFYKYRKLSNDEAMLKLIEDAHLSLWPSKWFEAFEYLPEVNEGRYDGNTQEKLAELMAQYILIPERLKKESPTIYDWLKDTVFSGIEYQGYDTCSRPLTRPLQWWEDATGKALGQ